MTSRTIAGASGIDAATSPVIPRSIRGAGEGPRGHTVSGEHPRAEYIVMFFFDETDFMIFSTIRDKTLDPGIGIP